MPQKPPNDLKLGHDGIPGAFESWRSPGPLFCHGGRSPLILFLRGDREEEGTEEEEEAEQDPNQSKKVAPRDQKVFKNVSQTTEKASQIS